MRKRCSHCKKIQGLKQYSKNSTNRDGYDHYCKNCNRKRLHAYFQTAQGQAAIKRASARRKKARR